MARRILAAAVAICLSGWALHAAERATFILTDGERVSGTVVFHTNTRENLIDNDFSLGVTPGQPEQIFHYDQVAVIDFMGGSPRNNELAALPDNGHLLVMRNGSTQRGHFVNMIGGDTVRWQDENGSTREMPIRDVGRIYLNPQAARTVFNFRGNPNRNAANNGAPYGRSGQNAYGRNFQIVASNVQVQANRPWNDTGVDVMQGDVMRFDAQGNVSFIQGSNNTTDAGGKNEMKGSQYPVSSLGVGALIGKVGTNGTPFAIGSNRGAVTVPATGRLYLGVNDDAFGDNSGAYTVTVMRGR